MDNKKVLEGEVVCVSGKFENHTQEEMESMVTENGGTVSSSVTKKTTMLVTGDKVGATKLNKAKELGIRIVDQSDFFGMVHPTDSTDDDSEANSENEKHHYQLVVSCRATVVCGYTLADDWNKDLEACDGDYEELFGKYYNNRETADLREIFLSDDDFLLEVCDEDGNDVTQIEDFDDIKMVDTGGKTSLLYKDCTYLLGYSTQEDFSCSLSLETDGQFDPQKLYFDKKSTDLGLDEEFHIDDLRYKGGDLELEEELSGEEYFSDLYIAEFDKKNGWKRTATGDYDYPETQSQPFKGEVVCVSGKFGEFEQKDVEAMVEKNGATISSSVTKKTTLLIIGEKVSAAKLTKASELGVRIMQEAEFYKTVNMLKPCKLEYSSQHKNLVDFEIPMGVTIIGRAAFIKCTNLRSVKIPDSVTKIEDYAFDHCTGLTSIEIPDSVKEIGYGAFEGCTGLTSVEIPNSVKKIAGWLHEGSFCGCTGLKSVVIPASVTEIEDGAFSGCAGLRFFVDEGNPSYTSLNGLLLTKDKKVLLLGAVCGNVVVPSSVEKIGEYAFYGCTGLTSVEIPSSVKVIGGGVNGGSFSGCTGLTSVVIPSSVEKIGEYAFSGCTGLTSVEIPSSVKLIGENAFERCTGLTSVEIPNSVKKIGEYAFYGCTGLTSVEILASVKEIGYGAFYGCTGLTSVEIPDSVTEIGGEAFSGCTGLTSVEIPDSVTEIGGEAFRGCTGLTSVEIPDSVTGIGDGAFINCTGLTSVIVDEGNPSYASLNGVLLTKDKKVLLQGVLCGNVVIPASVKEIGEWAFKDCTGLTSVEIPASVTEIGEMAFDGCTGLTGVEIPDSVTKIGGMAFRGCTGLTSVEIPASVTKIGSSAFSGCTGLTSVVIPASVKEIGRSAFEGCIGLTSVVIPASVKEIGQSAFEGCIGLTSLFVDEDNPSYASLNGLLLTKDKKVLLQGAGCGNVVIPSSVTKIGNSAFYGFTGLTSVEIPDSVAEIGDGAFSGCTGLTSVEIPDSVAEIGLSTFSGCTGLTSVEIPASVTKIGGMGYVGGSFSGCTGLTSFFVDEGNPSYASLNGLLLTKDKKVLLRGAGCGNVVVPSSVTKIGQFAFSGCTGLTSVVIPASVKEIGVWAFEDCTGLTSVEIPDSVTEIGQSTFSGCTGLTSVVIPASVKEIGQSAFRGCTGLTSVVIPSSVKEIGASAFEDCPNLKIVRPE